MYVLVSRCEGFIPIRWEAFPLILAGFALIPNDTGLATVAVFALYARSIDFQRLIDYDLVCSTSCRHAVDHPRSYPPS
jgi:hypothetical protein